MNNVIEIPTIHNELSKMVNEVRRGARIECAAHDGSVMFRVEDVELWWTFEEAAEVSEMLSDALGDAFSHLLKDMEKINERG